MDTWVAGFFTGVVLSTVFAATMAGAVPGVLALICVGWCCLVLLAGTVHTIHRTDLETLERELYNERQLIWENGDLPANVLPPQERVVAKKLPPKQGSVFPDYEYLRVQLPPPSLFVPSLKELCNEGVWHVLKEGNCPACQRQRCLLVEPSGPDGAYAHLKCGACDQEYRFPYLGPPFEVEVVGKEIA